METKDSAELRDIWAEHEDAIVGAVNTARANGENLEYHLDTPLTEFLDAVEAHTAAQVAAAKVSTAKDIKDKFQEFLLPEDESWFDDYIARLTTGTVDTGQKEGENK